jgi:hypothetical protein
MTREAPMIEKIRWFVYEVDPSVQVGILEKLKPCNKENSPAEALSNIYRDNTDVYEGHDVMSGNSYFVFKSWDTMFIVSTSRMKVKGEKRIFESWA